MLVVKSWNQNKNIWHVAVEVYLVYFLGINRRKWICWSKH